MDNLKAHLIFELFPTKFVYFCTMAAKDKFHQELRASLEKDGWIITHDPYILAMSETNYEVDLGAEKVIAAEKEGTKIAIELKSFLGESLAYDFHEAFGQFLEYRIGIEIQEPDRVIYLAMTGTKYEKLMKLTLPTKAIERYKVSLLIFDPEQKIILQWIKK